MRRVFYKIPSGFDGTLWEQSQAASLLGGPTQMPDGVCFGLFSLLRLAGAAHLGGLGAKSCSLRRISSGILATLRVFRLTITHVLHSSDVSGLLCSTIPVLGGWCFAACLICHRDHVMVQMLLLL